MVKRVATALLAVALGATALAAAPAYADVTPSPTPSPSPTAGDTHEYVPDPRILWIDVNPNPVVVRKHGSVTVTATVKTKDIKSLSIEVWEPNGDHHGDGNEWFSKKDEPAKYDGPKWDVKSQSWSFDWSHKTGTWKVHVEAIGVDGKTVSADRGFYVKHEEWNPRPKGPKATRITGFDATPEPVRKGRKLDLQGKIQVAQCYGDWHYEWDSYVSVHGGDDYCYDSRNYWHDWHWLGYEDVDVYFLPKGSKNWKFVDTIESNPDGTFYTQVRATRSGTWGVRFDGTRRLKGSEAYDYVKVVRH